MHPFLYLLAAYNVVKGTAILSFLNHFGLIAVIIIFKVFLKKSTLYPTIILGTLAGKRFLGYHNTILEVFFEFRFSVYFLIPIFQS